MSEQQTAPDHKVVFYTKAIRQRDGRTLLEVPSGLRPMLLEMTEIIRVSIEAPKRTEIYKGRDLDPSIAGKLGK